MWRYRIWRVLGGGGLCCILANNAADYWTEALVRRRRQKNCPNCLLNAATKLIRHMAVVQTVQTGSNVKHAEVCNKIQVTGSGANTEARAGWLLRNAKGCLLACVSHTQLPSHLPWYILTHLMLGGPVDSLNCPFQDICFRMTYSCHLVGHVWSC